eukprot:4722491-Pleurochrysis_carterae.AAC.1
MSTHAYRYRHVAEWPHGSATHRRAAALRHRWRLYRVTDMTSRDATFNELVYCTYIDGINQQI